tara:strand:- start:207 stop:707 length:501 start_codon:yes stop_codon:yes gene_type:complete
MKKYEAVIILNPNLSSKVEVFLKDFEKLLNTNSFSIIKCEDIGRRQLAYSINNHNKGHYLLFNIEGDPIKLIELENNIKYNESIIRHLFMTVKEHSGEDSQLLIDSKNKKTEDEEKENKTKKEELKTNNLDDKNEKNQIKSEKAIEENKESLKDDSEEDSPEEKDE